MEESHAGLNLRVLAFQSWLALVVGLAGSIIPWFQQTKSEAFSTLPFLFAGMIGMAAYYSIAAVHRSIARVTKRLDQMEDIASKSKSRK